LDVGLILEFSLGVEVMVSGEVDISADLTATLEDGSVISIFWIARTPSLRDGNRFTLTKPTSQS
jgi:hypothetical protein